LDYYVDSSSTNTIELGTEEYPFKSIMLPFVEILNIHSHSSRSITINLMESTRNILHEHSAYLINATSVTIKSHAPDQPQPRPAEIYVMAGSEFEFEKSTRFNIISNTALQLSSALSKDGMTSIDRTVSSFTTSALIINRGSLTLDNLVITRNHVADKDRATTFIRAVNIQDSAIIVTNSEFYLSGRIMRSANPLNLFVQNVYIDFYALMGAFRINAG